MSSATPSPSERDARLYVEDMIAFCDRVLEYTRAVDRAAFIADRMRHDATLRNLELIGEAATRIGQDIRDKAPQVPWRQWVATRSLSDLLAMLCRGRLRRQPSSCF